LPLFEDRDFELLQSDVFVLPSIGLASRFTEFYWHWYEHPGRSK